MSKTIIVGGGLSGLSAALFLKLKNITSSVSIIESSGRLGGWVQSKNFKDGSVHELGPRTVRMNSPTVNYLLQLIEHTKLSDKVISISKNNKAFHKRFIFAHNQLSPLDFSLLKPAQKPFTESFLLKIVKAGLKKYHHEANLQDLPVDYFIRTRFGDEIADYLVNPLIRGIYACDSKSLSILSTFPQLLEMEKLGPNVVIGSLKHYINELFQSNPIDQKINCPILRNIIKQSSVISFYGGLETLIHGLRCRLEQLGVSIETDNPVTKLAHHVASNKIIIHHNDTTSECDNVILAVPSHVSSTLLSAVVSNHELLNNIHWNTVAVVVLEYEGRLMPHCGFGHLIPSWEIADTLGVIYDSCILPQNDSMDKGTATTTRYTVMIGGAWFHQGGIDQLDSRQLVDKARAVLQRQLGVEGELARSTVAVNHRCIPVYGLKHRQLVATVREDIAVKQLPIRLCGNSYDGVSVSDCVYSAYKAVHAV